MFTEATPVNDRHAHLQTNATVILHPLFLYRLKLIEPASQPTFLRWQAQRVLGHFTRKPFRQSLKKQRYANPGLGGKPDPNRFIFFIPIDTRLKIIQHVDFIHDQQRRDLISFDFREHRINCVNIFLHAHIGRINDMQQQRRLARLLERRFKRGHQIVRQVANKAYGIRQDGFADIRDINPAQRWIQSGEQLVRSIVLGFGYLVEQRGFTGVGITDQRHGWNIGFGA